MPDKKKALAFISKKLKGYSWSIFSGFAVEIYTNGKRKGNDIDIIVPEDKIDEIAKIFGVKPVLETREKQDVKIVNDYYVETMIEGVPVEFVGKTEKFIIKGKEYILSKNTRELFKYCKRMKYLGVDVFVVPIEEIIVQKILMNRSGKWQDKKDIERLLRTHVINQKLLNFSLDRWNVPKDDKESIFKELI